MTLYTYGTLIFPEVWQAVVGTAYDTVPARAPGFAVYRISGVVYPGMVRVHVSELAEGVVHLAVSKADLARLDRFEDDCYVRETIDVVTEDGQKLAAFTYVIPPERQAVLSEEPWTAEEFAARGDLRRFMNRYQGFQRLATNY